MFFEKLQFTPVFDEFDEDYKKTLRELFSHFLYLEAKCAFSNQVIVLLKELGMRGISRELKLNLICDYSLKFR